MLKGFIDGNFQCEFYTLIRPNPPGAVATNATIRPQLQEFYTLNFRLQNPFRLQNCIEYRCPKILTFNNKIFDHPRPQGLSTTRAFHWLWDTRIRKCKKTCSRV